MNLDTVEFAGGVDTNTVICATSRNLRLTARAGKLPPLAAFGA